MLWASLRQNCPMVKQLKTKKMKKKNLLMTTVAILCFATITMAQVPTYVPTIGLDGWWSFNTNANDLSGNGNNGTVNGASLTSDRNGNPNSAYSFNGSSDFILLPNFFLGGSTSVSDLTYFLEFKIDQLPPSGTAYTISGQQSNWRHKMINIESDGTIQFHGTSSSAYFDGISPLSSIVPNQWYCVAITFSSSTIKLYLDGLLVSTSTTSFTNMDYSWFSGGNQPSFPTNYFGGFHVSAGITNYFQGTLDNFGVWNRVLTNLEISNLCQNCNISVTTQPINQSVNISNNAQFTTASSDPLATYQWQTDLGVGFQNLNSVGQYSGTTNDTLTIANTTLSNNNQPFRCIISSGSCSDTSNVAILTVNNNVGINEITQDNLFSVYPNPAKSQINVKADAKLLGSIYTVYDNTGKLIFSGKIISENTTIELGNLSGGIYLFSVGENLKQTFKVIKE